MPDPVLTSLPAHARASDSSGTPLPPTAEGCGRTRTGSVDAVAHRLGIRPEYTSCDISDSASAYLVLAERLAGFADRDLAPIWDERFGWAAAIESSCGEELTLVAFLGTEPVPHPRRSPRSSTICWLAPTRDGSTHRTSGLIMTSRSGSAAPRAPTPSSVSIPFPDVAVRALRTAGALIQRGGASAGRDRPRPAGGGQGVTNARTGAPYTSVPGRPHPARPRPLPRSHCSGSSRSWPRSRSSSTPR